MNVERFIFSELNHDDMIRDIETDQEKELPNDNDQQTTASEDTDHADLSDSPSTENKPDATIEENSQETEELSSTHLFNEQDMEDSRQAGFEEGKKSGYNEGYKKASEEIKADEETQSKNLHKAMEALGEQFIAFTKEYWDKQKNIEAESVILAQEIANRIAGSTLGKNSLAIIEDLLHKILPALHKEPQFSIKLHPSLVSSFEKNIENITAKSPFWGDIKVIADQNLQLSDTIIEWEDGRVERSMNEIQQQITAICDKVLSQI